MVGLEDLPPSTLVSKDSAGTSLTTHRVEILQHDYANLVKNLIKQSEMENAVEFNLITKAEIPSNDGAWSGDSMGSGCSVDGTPSIPPPSDERMEIGRAESGAFDADLDDAEPCEGLKSAGDLCVPTKEIQLSRENQLDLSNGEESGITDDSGSTGYETAENVEGEKAGVQEEQEAPLKESQSAESIEKEVAEVVLEEKSLPSESSSCERWLNEVEAIAAIADANAEKKEQAEMEGREQPNDSSIKKEEVSSFDKPTMEGESPNGDECPLGECAAPLPQVDEQREKEKLSTPLTHSTKEETTEDSVVSHVPPITESTEAEIEDEQPEDEEELSTTIEETQINVEPKEEPLEPYESLVHDGTHMKEEPQEDTTMETATPVSMCGSAEGVPSSLAHYIWPPHSSTPLSLVIPGERERRVDDWLHSAQFGHNEFTLIEKDSPCSPVKEETNGGWVPFPELNSSPDLHSEPVDHPNAELSEYLDTLNTAISRSSLGCGEGRNGATFPRGMETPKVSPIKADDCPVALKRIKVGRDFSMENVILAGEDNFILQTTYHSPTPSSIPERLLKLAWNGCEGAVALRVPLRILQRMIDVHSKHVVVRGLPWCLFLRPQPCPTSPDIQLSVFLKCLSTEPFSCHANQLNYTLHHPVDGTKDMVKRDLKHTFSERENDWGFNSFISVNGAQHFMAPDGQIFISCQFRIDYPQGMSFLREETRLPIGIINQGATCYMNSAIQILFSTKILSKAILQLEFKEGDTSVMRAVQKLFYQMLTRIEAVSTDQLTMAFGWREGQRYNQHDVQEMMKILLDKIETALKTSPRWSNLVDDLFKTKTRTFIRCVDVEYESGRDEHCLDIQLPVGRGEGAPSPFDIMSALRELTKTEMLDGDNKYHAEGHGLQRAEKGQRFVSFPKILHLQLLRFQLDYTTCEYVKMNDRVEFTDLIDLREFIEGEEGEKGELEYALHGVVSHSGAVGGGHYVTFICKYPGADVPKWSRFDDSIVTPVDDWQRVVMEENFGNGSKKQDGSFNAYMLTYIRRDCLREVLGDVAVSEVRASLVEEAEREREREKWRAIEDRNGLYGHTARFRFALEPEAFSRRVWDHFDFIKWRADPYRFEMLPDEPAIKLYHEAQKLAPNSRIRLWEMNTKNKEGPPNWRISREVESDLLYLQTRSIKTVLGLRDHILFVMTSEPLRLNARDTDAREEDWVVVLFKYYDSDSHCTSYLSPFFLPPRLRLSRCSPALARAARLPEATQLKYWREKSASELEELDDLEEMLIPMGDVIVVESVHMREDEEGRSIQSILLDERKVKVHFEAYHNVSYFKSIEETSLVALPPQRMSMTTSLKRVAETLGGLIDHPADKLLLWVHKRPVGSKELGNKLSGACFASLTEDPREDAAAQISYTRLGAKLSRSEQRQGVWSCVKTIGDEARIGYRFIKRGLDFFKRYKEQIEGETKRRGERRPPMLRYVWRVRSANLSFVFREMREQDDMEKELLAGMGDSITVCVDEMEPNEGRLGEGEVIIPILVLSNLNLKTVKNEVVSFFLKAGLKENANTLKKRIERKIRGRIDWQMTQLAAFCGSRYVKIDDKDMAYLYEISREDEAGVSGERDTKVALILYTPLVQQRIEQTTCKPSNQNHSIIIRD